jgi:hypothetical protein
MIGLERAAPFAAAAGAVVGWLLESMVLSLQDYVASSLLSVLDYVTLILTVVILALPPAIGASTLCTCFHPRQWPLGGRVRAFLGAFLGGLVLLLVIGIFLAPLLAGVAVYRYHVTVHGAGGRRTWLRAERLRFLATYLILLIVAGLVPLGNLFEGSGTGGHLVLMFYFPAIALLFLAGSYFLLRARSQSDGSRRETDVVTGIALHSPLLAALTVYSIYAALPTAPLTALVFLSLYLYALKAPART